MGILFAYVAIKVLLYLPGDFPSCLSYTQVVYYNRIPNILIAGDGEACRYCSLSTSRDKK